MKSYNSEFVCSICGDPKPATAKVAPGAKYCRDCSNDYQAMRRRVQRAGFKFTMLAYKKNRIKRGLPTQMISGQRGRPRKEEQITVDCKVCSDPIILRDLKTDYEGLGQICVTCGRDYERHYEHLKPLSMEWYIALRTKVMTVDGVSGADRPMLLEVNRGRGRVANAHLEQIREDYVAIRLTMSKYPDPKELVRLLEGSTKSAEPIERDVSAAEGLVPCQYDPDKLCEHRHCRRQAGG